MDIEQSWKATLYNLLVCQKVFYGKQLSFYYILSH
jgi:hypothetical protein